MSARARSLMEYMLSNPDVQMLKSFKHHRRVTTYEHSVNVMKLSIRMAKRLRLSESKICNLIIGSMLHDFFLYDYHDRGRVKKDGIHAWSHPRVALDNAERYFVLNREQENIIRSHMFPVTLLHPPRCKEAFIVCIADKICATKELLPWCSDSVKFSTY